LIHVFHGQLYFKTKLNQQNHLLSIADYITFPVLLQRVKINIFAKRHEINVKRLTNNAKRDILIHVRNKQQNTDINQKGIITYEKLQRNNKL
jgi:hypothetical protein